MTKVGQIIIFAIVFSFSFGTVSSQIDSVKSQLSKVREQIDNLSAAEKDISSQIDGMDKQISLLNSLLDMFQRRIDSLNTEIFALSDSAESQRKKWLAHSDELKKVLCEMYVSGEVPQWELFFAADDVNSLSEALVYFGALADARNKKIYAAKAAFDKYSGTVKILQASRDSVQMVRAQKRTAKDSLYAINMQRKAKLQKIRGSKKEFVKLVAQLSSSLENLEDMLAAERTKGGKFSKMKGHLPCPLGKKCAIAMKFGTVRDEKYGTYFSNPGVEIASKSGQEVFAVANGKVANIIWLEGYRNVVIVKHDGGYYTIYGNLDKVSVSSGEKISEGTAIGKVAGNSWLQDKPTLHFEVRHGKNKENPAIWMGSV